MTDSINGLPPALQGLVQQPQDREKKKGLGQEDFLKLMTAQLKNQSPLDPTSSADFLSQLAQFGTVNGINQLNQTVQTLASTMQSASALQASTLVGREVLVPASTVPLNSGGRISGAVELPQASGAVTLIVQDSAGQTVRTLSLGAQQAGRVEFTWDGLDEGGNPVPGGSYGIRVEASLGDATEALVPLIRDRVASVSLARDGTGPQLNLTALGQKALGDIREVM